MKTIDKILQKNGFTRLELYTNELKGICNGCGGKGGFNFEKWLKHLPGFDSELGEQLLKDLHLICGMHDTRYFFGLNYTDFIIANYKFTKNVFQLFYWTNLIVRVILFIMLFGGTTLFGYKYFKSK